MIDRALMDDALAQARATRAEIDTAISDVEAMISELQHFQPGRQRVVFSIAGWDDDVDSAH